MRLDINSKYCIVTSTYEVTVYSKSKDKKTGEPVLSCVPLGHCNTIQQACKTLLDNTIKGSTAINDMKQVSDELKAMKSDIDKSLEGFNVDKLTEKYKKFDDAKFDTDEKIEYDTKECGKSIFDMKKED